MGRASTFVIEQVVIGQKNLLQHLKALTPHRSRLDVSVHKDKLSDIADLECHLWVIPLGMLYNHPELAMYIRTITICILILVVCCICLVEVLTGADGTLILWAGF